MSNKEFEEDFLYNQFHLIGTSKFDLEKFKSRLLVYLQDQRNLRVAISNAWEKYDQIKKLVERDADEREVCAAHNGEKHDGGASGLRTDLKFWNEVLNLDVPNRFKKYESQLDPEYEDYKRLKAKFEKK